MSSWWRSRSLRARLTMVATGAVTLGLLAGAVALGLGFTRSRVGELDVAAREQALVVQQLVESDSLPDVLPTDPDGGGIVQVLDGRGQVLAASLTTSGTLALLSPEQLQAWPRDRPRSHEDRQLTGTPLRVELLDGKLRGEPVTVVSAVPLRGVQQTLGALRTVLLTVVPLLILAVGFGSWVLCGSALRPVEELRLGAERVGDLGGGGVLPAPRGSDEIARLAATLNRMLDRLADAGTRQRVFIADAAHEMRSPLASLRTQLEVARVHPAAAVEGDLTDDLLLEVLRLGRLVDDLLILARLDEGELPIRAAEVDLAALAHDVAAAAVAASEDGATRGHPAGKEVRVTGEGYGVGDPEALRRALRNLIDNALRHARTRVDITVSSGGVDVDDDGLGVPPEDRERIFGRFARRDDARARDAGGSGLGLAIARGIARAGGGDLTVADSTLGGAAFRLRTGRCEEEPAE